MSQSKAKSAPMSQSKAKSTPMSQSKAKSIPMSQSKAKSAQMSQSKAKSAHLLLPISIRCFKSVLHCIYALHPVMKSFFSVQSQTGSSTTSLLLKPGSLSGFKLKNIVFEKLSKAFFQIRPIWQFLTCALHCTLCRSIQVWFQNMRNRKKRQEYFLNKCNQAKFLNKCNQANFLNKRTTSIVDYASIQQNSSGKNNNQSAKLAKV